MISSNRHRHVQARWNHFWFRTCPPHNLAIFRILFGAYLLFQFGLELPHVAMIYSSDGIHLPLPLLMSSDWATVLFAAPPLWLANMLFGIFMTALLLFTLGAWTRVSTAVSFVLYGYFWIISMSQFGTSFHRLFLFMLLVMSFSGAGSAFSLDMRCKRGSWTAWEPISILPQRLLAIQISAMYLGVGLQKLVIAEWRSGAILSYGFIGRWATAPAFAVARWNIPIAWYDALNVLVKSLEVTIPFGLWIKRYQWWFFLGGALFHIFIAIFLAIWWFLPLIAAYVLFLDPEEVRIFFTRKPKSAIMS